MESNSIFKMIHEFYIVQKTDVKNTNGKMLKALNQKKTIPRTKMDYNIIFPNEKRNKHPTITIKI